MNPRHRRLLIPGLLVLLLVVVVIASLTGRSDAETIEVTRVTDPRITESSGLAVSLRDPDLAYTINDSGSEPEVYAVSLANGDTVGVTRLAGATWFDPEALTIAPDGTLWVADTGDNGLQRQKPMLYGFAEPGRASGTVTPSVSVLQLPDGPADIEAVAADPAGGFALVTKGVLGGELLRLDQPPRPDAPNPVVATGTPMPALATDAVYTADGHLAVRTYTDVEVFDGDVSIATLSTPPAPQAETVATLADGSLLVGSEGVGQALHRVTWTAPEPKVATVSSSSPPSGPTSPDMEARHAWWAPLLHPWTIGLALTAGFVAIMLRRARR